MNGVQGDRWHVDVAGNFLKHVVIRESFKQEFYRCDMREKTLFE